MAGLAGEWGVGSRGACKARAGLPACRACRRRVNQAGAARLAGAAPHDSCRHTALPPPPCHPLPPLPHDVPLLAEQPEEASEEEEEEEGSEDEASDFEAEISGKKKKAGGGRRRGRGAAAAVSPRCAACLPPRCLACPLGPGPPPLPCWPPGPCVTHAGGSAAGGCPPYHVLELAVPRVPLQQEEEEGEKEEAEGGEAMEADDEEPADEASKVCSRVQGGALCLLRPPGHPLSLRAPPQLCRRVNSLYVSRAVVSAHAGVCQAAQGVGARRAAAAGGPRAAQRHRQANPEEAG